MRKTPRTTKTDKMARKLLVEKHEFYNSWALVSEELGGVNRGLLSAVASGKRKAPKSLIAVLGLKKPPKSLFDWPITSLAQAIRERR